MKLLRLFTFVCCSLLVGQYTFAEGIEFFHGTWAETLKKAHEEEKVIFVDSYTTWCGPCKRMAANTFPDPEVGEYFNAHFVSVKIDMEKDAGLEFRRTYPVTAYPTLFFINADGEVIIKSVGGKLPKDLLVVAKKANKNNDRSGKYKDSYDKGERDFDLVFNYVKALNKAKKPSLKIANDYLKSAPEITDSQRRKFLLEAATEVDSKLFAEMISEKKAIEKELTKELVEKKITAAAIATIQKGIKYEATSLIDEAIAVIKEHFPENAEYLESRSWLDYALAMRDGEMYKKYVKPFVKKIVKTDAAELFLVATDITEYFIDDKDLMSIAEQASARAFELKNIYAHLETHINILCSNGKTDDAIKLIEQRIEKAEKENNTKAIGPLKKLKVKISNT